VKRVRISKRAEERVRRGHPWVYQGEIEDVRGTVSPGEIVNFEGHRGRTLGKGCLNVYSTIALRVLTLDPQEEIDRSFWARRITRAWQYRKEVVYGKESDSYRLIFGEADFLPGLIVDQFASVLVIQILTAGIEKHREVIQEILWDLVHPAGIYERSDVGVRELEGLSLRSGLLAGEVPDLVEIRENGLRLKVDVKFGQKTGYFLDQRENRAFLKRFSLGKRVLDCFSHLGGFGLHAGFFGAREVIGVDISESAVQLAMLNARLNKLENTCRFEVANAFDFLRTVEREKERFDMVILDPPAFAKSKKNLEGAIRGYKEINLRAMKILSSGGLLVTCSCSHHLSWDLFLKVVEEASLDAKRRIRFIAQRGQAPDHPILLGYGESEYLKCLFCEVV